MEHAEFVAPVSFPKSMIARRERTTGTAWKGLGASLLLHLLVGAAAIGALSGRAEIPPPVIDLTLSEPAVEGPHATTGPEETRVVRTDAPIAATRPDEPPAPGPPAPARSSNAAIEPPSVPPGTPVAQELPSLAGLSTHMGRVAAATQTPRSDTAVERNTPVGAPTGSPPGEGGGKATTGNPGVNIGSRRPEGSFSYIRDAVQREIAYPATARRMGWEGKVVVAFLLLPDGSVRDVRVVQGSGHAALDRGAIDAVRNASPFPRSPVGAEVITPVVYRLTAR
jgi:protein TonB